MKITFSGDIKSLEAKLMKKSIADFQEVGKKSIRSIFARSQQTGGTPIGQYTGGGQLRQSASYSDGEFGYVKEYAPHVEFGHRTRGGGSFVPGQYYLKKNIDTERPLYRENLINKIKE